MTSDIVSRLSARKQQTGVAARIAGTVALALLLWNGAAFSSDSAAPRPVAPYAGPTVEAILKYLDELPLRENERCLTGQAVGANGNPDEARASFQKDVVGLAYASDFVAPLEDAGVPLLFELFNEFNGNWNRMGKAEPEEFQKLWRYTFNYFARERKFSNLLFVLEYSSNTLQREKFSAKDYYPGDDYVDIVGFDFYHDDPQDKYVDVYQQVCEFGKPVAMTEYGPNLRVYRNEHKIAMGKAIDVWDNMVQLKFTKSLYPECCFFIRWGNDWSIISQKNAKEFMADSWWGDWKQFKQDAVTGGWR